MNETIHQHEPARPGLVPPRDDSYTRGGGHRQPSMNGARERSHERLGRPDRTVTTLLATMVGSIILGFVAIGGQLLGVEREIGALRAEVVGLSGRVDVLTERVDDLSGRMTRVETVLRTHHGPLPGP
jgi:cell division protein FtsL